MLTPLTFKEAVTDILKIQPTPKQPKADRKAARKTTTKEK
jgi:hypothetical protein